MTRNNYIELLSFNINVYIYYDIKYIYIYYMHVCIYRERKRQFQTQGSHILLRTYLPRHFRYRLSRTRPRDHSLSPIINPHPLIHVTSLCPSSHPVIPSLHPHISNTSLTFSVSYVSFPFIFIFAHIFLSAHVDLHFLPVLSAKKSRRRFPYHPRFASVSEIPSWL